MSCTDCRKELATSAIRWTARRARWCVLPALLCVLAGAVARGEQFELVHEESGRAFGPFEFRDGETLAIGSAAFTLRIREAAALSIRERLEQVTIPQIEFRQAAISDVIAFLREASVQFSRAKNEQDRGVNIVLDLQGRTELDAPTITFSARHLSLREVLEAVTGISGFQYEVRPNWILVRPKPDKPKPESP